MLFLRSLPLPAAQVSKLALACLLLLCACSWPPSIVVVIPAIPAGATSLSVLVSAPDKQAAENPRLDVTAFVGQGYRFGVHPPLSATGVFSVAVATYDKNGCLMSTAAGEIELSAADNDGFVYGRPERSLQLLLDAVPPDYASLCLSSTPSLRSFVQSEDDPALAVISGWGFAPGVAVSIDDVPALSVTRKDATRIEARFAIAPIPSGLRTALLNVKNTDGASLEKNVSLYSVAFAPRERNTYSLDASLEPVAVAVADLNKDSKQDVVVAGLRNTTAGFISFYKNQGTGQLPSVPSMLEFPTSVDDVQLADMDLDGAVDVVGISAGGRTLIFLLNDGQGNFAMDRAFTLPLPATASPVTLAIGNVLGDASPDVVVASNASPSSAAGLIFYQGSSSGINFIGELDVGFVLMGNLLVRDVDKDGRDDVIFAQTTPGVQPNPLLGYVQVMLSNGAGAFMPKPTLTTAAGAYAQVAALDIDGDSLLDLVASGVFTPSQQIGKVLSLFINQGAANYPANRSEVTTQAQPFAMAVADINHDGQSDLVLSHIFKEGQGRVSALLNLGGSRGFADVALQPSYLIGYGDNFVAAGDLNADGKSDFVVVNRGVPKLKQPALLQVFLNTSL